MPDWPLRAGLERALAADDLPKVVVLAQQGRVDAARRGTRARYTLATALLDATIPDTVGLGGIGTRPTIAEMALFDRVQQGAQLGYRAESLALAEQFAVRYPDSALLTGVDATVTSIRSAFERREAALSTVDDVQSRAERIGHQLRCAGLPDRGDRQEACIVWVLQDPQVRWPTVLETFSWGASTELRDAMRSAIDARAPELVPARDQRLDDARAALETLRTSFDDTELVWPARALEAAEQRAFEALAADLHVLYAKADGFRSQGLYEEAARALHALSEQAPDFGRSTGAASLLAAADMLRQGKPANWDLKRTAWLRTIVDRWPDSDEATQASRELRRGPP